MGGRWKTFSLFYKRLITSSSSSSSSSSKSHFLSFNRSISLAAAPSEIPDPDPIGLSAPDIDPTVKIPVKAYFLSTRYPSILSYSSSILSMAPFAILCFVKMGRSRTLVSAMLLITSATVPFKRRRPCCMGVEICTS